MSGVDTAWLRMERPTNLMMISGVIITEQAIELDDLVATFEDKFLAFHRFRQKAVQGLTGTYWVDDRLFSVRNHIHRTALAGDGGKEALEDLLGELVSTPLDFSKPLWQVHLVENYAGGSAVIIRIHHCYADGIALIQVLLSMTSAAEPGERGKRRSGNALTNLAKPAVQLVGTSIEFGRQAVEEARRLVREPSHVLDHVKRGLGMADDVRKATLVAADPPSSLRGKLGVRKRAAWAEPIPLDEVKAIGKALGCTVNDVLLASVAGALGHYMREMDDETLGMELKAAVPVNLRSPKKALELGNHFGVVFLHLPVGLTNPLERLYRVHHNMTELKRSKQPIIMLGLLNVAGRAPQFVQEMMLELFASRPSTVMTNVPGPQQALTFCGSTVNEQMFWVPQTGNIALGISILSYNGRVHFGLLCDESVIPHPDRIIQRFAHEFEKLVLLTLMEPVGQVRDAAAIEADLDDWLGRNAAG
jgi:WS/DGAT/MGAT family acyltransferase